MEGSRDYQQQQGSFSEGDDGEGGAGGSLKRPADGDYNGNVKRMREYEGNGQQITIRILVQSKDAGGIIGKGGSNIKRLRSEYSAVVNVPDTNTSERVLTITAPQSSALAILEECIPKIGEFHQGDSNAGHDIKMLVQRSQVGSIIGRAGYKIKEIREKSGANIKVFSDCLPNSTERSVAISGSPDVIVKCVETILETLESTPLKGQVILFDPAMNSGGYDEWGFGGGFGGPDGYGGGQGGGGRGLMGGPMRGGQRGGSRGGPRGRGGRGGRGGGGGGRGGGSGFSFGDSSGGAFGAGGGGGSGGGGSGASGTSGSSGTGTIFGGGDFSQDNMGSGFGDTSNFGGMNQWNQGGSDQPASSTQVTIPKDLAGSIIGKGGERIRQIRQRSNAQIKIDDPLPGSTDRVISISGSQDAINYAQYLLQQSVRQFSGKKF